MFPNGDCLKTCGVASVRAVPGYNLITYLCRHCSEFETLACVLSYGCQRETLRIMRHNDIRTLLARASRVRDYEVQEEVELKSP